MLATSPARPEPVDAVNLNHPPTEPTEMPSPLSLQSPAAQPPQPPPVVGRPVLTGRDVSSAEHVGMAASSHVVNVLPHDGIDTFPDQDGTSRASIYAAQRVEEATGFCSNQSIQIDEVTSQASIDADAAQRVEEPTGFCNHISSYRHSPRIREISLEPPCGLSWRTWMGKAHTVFMHGPQAGFGCWNRLIYLPYLCCCLVLILVHAEIRVLGSEDPSKVVPFIIGAIFVLFNLGIILSYACPRTWAMMILPFLVLAALISLPILLCAIMMCPSRFRARREMNAARVRAEEESLEAGREAGRRGDTLTLSATPSQHPTPTHALDASPPNGAASLQPPFDALRGLHSAVSAIEEHFAQASAAGSSKALDSLGNDQKNKEIGVLVRGQLCTALSHVLLDGFKSFKSVNWIRDMVHIWDFVAASCEATHVRMRRTGGQYSHAEKTMTDAVDEASLDPFFQVPICHT